MRQLMVRTLAWFGGITVVWFFVAWWLTVRARRPQLDDYDRQPYS